MLSVSICNIYMSIYIILVDMSFDFCDICMLLYSFCDIYMSILDFFMDICPLRLFVKSCVLQQCVIFKI